MRRCAMCAAARASRGKPLDAVILKAPRRRLPTGQGAVRNPVQLVGAAVSIFPEASLKGAEHEQGIKSDCCVGRWMRGGLLHRFCAGGNQL